MEKYFITFSSSHFRFIPIGIYKSSFPLNSLIIHTIYIVDVEGTRNKNKGVFSTETIKLNENISYDFPIKSVVR